MVPLTIPHGRYKDLVVLQKQACPKRRAFVAFFLEVSTYIVNDDDFYPIRITASNSHG
jgi:hypothetical protein